MSATPSSSGVGRCGSVAGGAPDSATPPSPSRETRTPVRPISTVSVARGTGEGEVMGACIAILGGGGVLVNHGAAGSLFYRIFTRHGPGAGPP